MTAQEISLAPGASDDDPHHQNEIKRSGFCEVLIKNSWCQVFAELYDDHLSITLQEPLERLVQHANDFEIPGEDLSHRKRTVIIKKKPGEGLGISIKGGKENQMPILISKIFSGLAADSTGQLFVGDAILSCNDQNLKDSTHENAVLALKNSGDTVRLEVRYLPEVVPFFREASIFAEIEWSMPKNPIFTVRDRNRGKNFRERSCHSKIEPKMIPLFGAFVRRIQLVRIGSNNNVPTRSKPFYSPESDYNSATAENSTSESSSANVQQQVIIIQSPELTKTCILRFNSEVKCTSWFLAIHKMISNLNQMIMNHVNKQKSFGYFDNSKIAYLGWFLERKKVVPTDTILTNNFKSDESKSRDSSSATNLFEQYEKVSKWRPVFFVLTTRDLFFYDTFPFFETELSPYRYLWPLLQTRFIYIGRMNAEMKMKTELIRNATTSSQSSSLSSLHDTSNAATFHGVAVEFGLRTGSSTGIQGNFFCAQLCFELSQFSKQIIFSTCQYVRQLQNISIACLDGSIESILRLQYKKGIKVNETKTGKLLHHIPFDQLLSTRDDGRKNLILICDQDRKFELNLLQNLQSFIFILHSFLLAQSTEVN